MKKIVLALTAAGALLTACGNEEAENPESEQEVGKAEVQAPEVTVETNESENGTVGSEAGLDGTGAEVAGKDNGTVGSQTVNELPEYKTITDKVGAEYIVETETDNEGTRVLFLKDQNGEKQYKTIYVKHDHHLKIIKINGKGGLVFEGEV